MIRHLNKSVILGRVQRYCARGPIEERSELQAGQAFTSRPFAGAGVLPLSIAAPAPEVPPAGAGTRQPAPATPDCGGVIGSGHAWENTSVADEISRPEDGHSRFDSGPQSTDFFEGRFATYDEWEAWDAAVERLGCAVCRSDMSRDINHEGWRA